ncbi:hypothetical protein AKJ09_04166 [Labilithrix luteola]|uniref:Lipoprotein n=1 Tax=Labilithrix luteola TaxID=1391654 RepID=A0A0K1PVE4_9BACT|nr:hypothetical protein [Labilithrix luteola]AKU97502.1 hypothetical protein AKJ09_04166 [Labilithrix luteola]
MKLNFLSIRSVKHTCALTLAALSTLLLVSGCKEKEEAKGLVVDAAVTATPAPVDAGPVDINQCPGCQLAPTPTWTFEGIYRDDKCTDPLAQTVTPACAAVPAIGQVSLTYIDEVGGRKVNEGATVTLTEIIAPSTPRFRKTTKGCVHANEAAVDVTPNTCAGARVCRDATGTLACAGCRTFANGCPDFEETRTYAAVNDPVAKGGVATGAAPSQFGNLAACCNALATQAKSLGASPEAGVLLSAAAQCSALAKSGSANSPELAALKGLLAGRNVPAVCKGL